MKVKVSEAEGRVLDWMAAKCEGDKDYYYGDDGTPLTLDEAPDGQQEWEPTINWAQAGPIIDREGISSKTSDWGKHPHEWAASMPSGHMATGPTPLIAAMRCFVASKLGEEVDVPSDLFLPTGFFRVKVRVIDDSWEDVGAEVEILWCVGGEYDDTTNEVVCNGKRVSNDDVYGGCAPKDFHVGHTEGSYTILEILGELK